MNPKLLQWPQEYKFLSKLLENTVNYTKVLQKIIEKLEKMVNEEHMMLELSKSKLDPNMSTQDKIKTVRTLVVPHSMKNNPSIHSAISRNMGYSSRIALNQRSMKYVI